MLNNSTGSGFNFRQKTKRIDWKLMAGVSVEKIIQDVDIKRLQEVLDSLIYCDMEHEALDSNYVKLFQLLQMAAEYLLHSQSQLISKLGQDVDVEAIRRENRQLKKTVYAFQLWSKMPQNQPTQVAEYHRCDHCTKVFNSESHLVSHLQRRHPSESYSYAGHQTKQVNDDQLEKITATIEKYSLRVLDTERQLRVDMEAKLNNELLRKTAELKERFDQDRQQFESQFQQYRQLQIDQIEQDKKSIAEQKALLIDQELKLKSEFAQKEDALLARLEQRFKQFNSTPASDVQNIQPNNVQQELDHQLNQLGLTEADFTDASKLEAVRKQLETKQQQDDQKLISIREMVLNEVKQVEPKQSPKKLSKSVQSFKALQSIKSSSTVNNPKDKYRKQSLGSRIATQKKDQLSDISDLSDSNENLKSSAAASTLSKALSKFKAKSLSVKTKSNDSELSISDDELNEIIS